MIHSHRMSAISDVSVESEAPPLVISVEEAWRRGGHALVQLQRSDGCWEGEAVWCPMITAQYVMTATITGQSISSEKQEGFSRYFLSCQLPDGSWGLHPGSSGYLFVTSLVYVAMRVLGHGPDETALQKARSWITAQGGVVRVPTWGKVWLALMNLYGWDGVNPVLPELWLLPDSNPIHPRRYYCHTRLIYLGIGVLSSLRLQHPVTSLIQALRQELYVQPYEDISFAKHRHDLHPGDMFAWPTTLTRWGYDVSRWMEKLAPAVLRKKALHRCMEMIEFEVQSTQYACISPVNGLLNTLALWAWDHEHPDFPKMFATLDHWLWFDQDGARYTGARSHSWDTSFAVQALCAGPDVSTWISPLQQAFHFLDHNQIQTELDNPTAWYRLPIRGGFCFSDKLHRWPVSDCTAEALSAFFQIQEATGQQLPPARLREAAEFLLLRQNVDGGWGSYESRRGNWFLEKLNPSEMYGNCMLEHSYIECTASCIHGLAAYLGMVGTNLVPAWVQQIQQAMKRGEAFLRQSQQTDGSWPGFWGVNYTYGTWFGVMGLRKAGVSSQDSAIQKAVAWLKQTQLPDGGWGEDWRSCREGRYMPTSQSLVIQTSWALITLLLAEQDDSSLIEPAVRWLIQQQESKGTWSQKEPAGVFFNTAMLDYRLYAQYFPVWALGMVESARQHNTWIKSSR